MEIEDKRKDLIITTNYAFDGRFSNRWKLDANEEPVDYDCVANWKNEMLQSVYPNLRRVKIRTLRTKIDVNRFLTNLSNSSPLLAYLEVDRIQLNDSHLELTFDSLQKLSIDSIKIVQDYRFQIDAKELQAIYLGESRFLLVKFLGT